MDAARNATTSFTAARACASATRFERFGGNDVYIRVSVYVFTRDLSTYARSVHVKVHTHVSRQLEHVQHRGGCKIAHIKADGYRVFPRNSADHSPDAKELVDVGLGVCRLDHAGKGVD